MHTEVIHRTTSVRRRHPARRAGLAAAALALAALALGAPPPADAAYPGPLLARMRAGGVVIACAPSATEAAGRGERALSAGGRAQAAELGEIVRRLGIPVGAVYAGPTGSSIETARLAFGRAERSAALDARDTAGRRALFLGPVPRGTNRVLVAHQSVLLQAVPGLDARSRARVAEGTCLMLDPAAASPFLGMLRPEEWRMFLR